jgi:hypothetical protein
VPRGSKPSHIEPTKIQSLENVIIIEKKAPKKNYFERKWEKVKEWYREDLRRRSNTSSVPLIPA